MNGAMAEPFVRTTKPPNTAIMMTIGTSQYFLRALRKAQSSRIRDMPASELVLEGFCERTWRFAQFPVSPGGRVKAKVQGPLADQPHPQPDRREDRVEHEPEHHRCNDVMH